MTTSIPHLAHGIAKDVNMGLLTQLLKLIDNVVGVIFSADIQNESMSLVILFQVFQAFVLVSSMSMQFETCCSAPQKFYRSAFCPSPWLHHGSVVQVGVLLSLAASRQRCAGWRALVLGCITAALCRFGVLSSLAASRQRCAGMVCSSPRLHHGSVVRVWRALVLGCITAA